MIGLGNYLYLKDRFRIMLKDPSTKEQDRDVLQVMTRLPAIRDNASQVGDSRR